MSLADGPVDRNNTESTVYNLQKSIPREFYQICVCLIAEFFSITVCYKHHQKDLSIVAHFHFDTGILGLNIWCNLQHLQCNLINLFFNVFLYTRNVMDYQLCSLFPLYHVM